MADMDFDDGGLPRFSAEQMQWLVHMAGAVCSVCLLIGLGVWGYSLAMRDVTAIPVIRAAEGPMRSAPADPGGEIATHQGMAVNRVAAMVPVSLTPEEVILAPEPIALEPEDAPGLSALVPLGAEASALPQEGLAQGGWDSARAEPALSAQPAAPPAPAVEEPVTVASTDEAVLLALSVDLEGLFAEETLAPESAPLAEAQAEGMLRPRPRPGSAPVPLEAVATVAAALPARLEASSLAAGTRLVQLGAFETEAEAQDQWARLSAQFGDLMASKAMVVQDALSGGRTFYRLRAHGFADEADARRFCAALLAENAACIPVAHR